MIFPYLSPTDLSLYSRLTKKSVLVTGASGVIGQAVAKLLRHLNSALDLDLKVTLVGRSEFRDGISGFPYSRVDLTNQSEISSLGEHDFVIHGATYAQPAKFERDIQDLIRLNSEATLSLKKLARLGFLFLSTSEVYSGGEPLSTESTPISIPTSHPRAPYVFGKLLGEAITHHRDVPTGNVARIALAYGPGFRTHDSRVMYDFFRKAYTDGVVSISGPHSMGRTYIHALDAAADLLAILVQDNGGTFNVGGEEAITILDLANAVSRLCGVPLLVSDTATAEPTNSPKLVSLNTNKISEARGGRKLISLDSGLEDIRSWIEESGVFHG
jgi:UDP-glucuronate decarboxylase